MSKKLVVYKRIEVDLEAERKRILEPKVYKKSERVALLSLVDALEKNDIKEAIKTYFNFPGCFREYVGIDVSDFLDDVIHDIAYNQELNPLGNLTNFFQFIDGKLTPIIPNKEVLEK